MENPSELWLKRDHKRDLAFARWSLRSIKGVVDAIYNPEQGVPAPAEATGSSR